MMMAMKKTDPVRAYFSEIGSRGGKKSRRALSPDAARDMVRVREARKAFRRFHAQCFWYLREDAEITREDIPEIVRGLRKDGGREGMLLAAKLCR